MQLPINTATVFVLVVYHYEELRRDYQVLFV